MRDVSAIRFGRRTTAALMSTNGFVLESLTLNSLPCAAAQTSLSRLAS